MNPTVTFGKKVLEVGSPQLGLMRDSSAIADDPAALRARLDDDGYLLIRGLYDRAEVLAARQEILELHTAHLRAGHPLLEGRLASPLVDAPLHTHGSQATRGPRFLRLVEGPRITRFFERLHHEPATTFDFKWLRLMRTGDASPAHFDNSYMGRGSARVCTVWTPLGDVAYEDGPLALIPHSQRLPSYARLRETLGMMDVDRDQVRGDFAADPFEFTRRFGGHWATSEFTAGDALIFGMFTLHASCENRSDRFRISSDTRFQPASDPLDERWCGETPKGHYAWFQGEGVSMAQKRQEWNL